MERLTHSDFVVNIYGYCGQSAINELADFPFPGITSLEDFDRRVRGKNSEHALAIKLRMAASVAMGVAHIHQAGDHKAERAAMVHYDLNPRNVALFAKGRPKLNDFNIAEFLRYDPATNKTCGFPSRMHEPWWRAPEEVHLNNTAMLDEKVDVYSLGNLLFHLLTTNAPHGKMKRERMEEVRLQVAAGERPILVAPYANSTHPVVKAFRQAMDLSFPLNPADRGTSQEIADVLVDALMNMVKNTPKEQEEPSVPETSETADYGEVSQET